MKEPQKKQIRVLVVDDSSFMRIALKRMVQSDPQLEVVGCARDAQQAIELVDALDPDVVTMDVEMPGMNGLEALKVIMSRSPRPVLMVSVATQQGAQMTLDALEAGAFDYIPKQPGDRALDGTGIRRDLIAKIKAAAASRARAPSAIGSGFWDIAVPATAVFAAPSVICIGSSTGGPKALQQILPRLPADLPAGIVVVQHMPAGFTGPFAARLDTMSRVRVKEAEQDDSIDAGKVLIAPAGWHITICRRAHSQYGVRLSKAPADRLHMPSVDIMMLSAAEVLRERAMGVILTGMGNDGEEGMRAIRETGGYTIGQDEGTCAVYGMPKACAEAGALARVLPLADIPREIVAVATACCV
ncbi:MAG: protein-glutamate methylesterase/protein-glutamine glutaminase [Acidobacteriaceae bacterium]